MIVALLAGILVAVFLRRFIGLNLFKTKDKVSERSVLTLVTQVRFSTIEHCTERFGPNHIFNNKEVYLISFL